MKCKYCGEEFEPNTRGRKKAYCNKAECIKKARNEANRKWYSSKMKTLKGTKNRIIEQKEEKKVVYSSTDKIDNNLKQQDISDIVQIARDLGTIRFQLIQMLQKENEKISNYDKADQDFLHKIENLEELTDEEAIALVVEEKKSRENRRSNKNRQYLIKGLLDGIIIKNPSQFIIRAVQRSKDYTYIPKVMEELKQDESLYDKKIS